MAPTISKAQRDALYDQILDRLSGIGDIEIAIEAGSYTAAERLSQEHSDDLRLLADLGFGERDEEPVELTVPPEVLRRALPRMRELAKNYTAGLEKERGEVREVEERNRLVAEACQGALADLEAPEADSRWKISRLPSLLPRFPQAWRRGHPGSVDERLVINRLFLSGVLVAEPVEEVGRDGKPVTLLLIVFADPDPGEAGERLMCEIEAPENVAKRYGKELRAGDSIFVTGQLSGGDGGILATEINPGPPPGEADART